MTRLSTTARNGTAWASRYREAAGCALITLLALLSACQSIEPRTRVLPENRQHSQFPLRQPWALSGSEFLLHTRQLSADEREHAILVEVLSGNVPRQMRQLTPVELNENGHRATVFVVPDYLAIGGDDNYVVMPMRPRTAMRIARQFGYLLPTRKLVDDIYQRAAVRLAPAPMPAGPKMRSNAYYRRHDGLIKAQWPQHNDATPLIAGHKKDVVLSAQLSAYPEQLAIYGWHRSAGDPIQPLSLYHGVNYVDYSHGIRLISRSAIVDGRRVDLTAVFTDPQLHALVSDEGQIITADSYL